MGDEDAHEGLVLGTMGVQLRRKMKCNVWPYSDYLSRFMLSH